MGIISMSCPRLHNLYKPSRTLHKRKERRERKKDEREKTLLMKKNNVGFHQLSYLLQTRVF
jgi:hypothetical protein